MRELGKIRRQKCSTEPKSGNANVVMNVKLAVRNTGTLEMADEPTFAQSNLIGAFILSSFVLLSTCADDLISVRGTCTRIYSRQSRALFHTCRTAAISTCCRVFDPKLSHSEQPRKPLHSPSLLAFCCISVLQLSVRPEVVLDVVRLAHERGQLVTRLARHALFSFIDLRARPGDFVGIVPSNGRRVLQGLE